MNLKIYIIYILDFSGSWLLLLKSKRDNDMYFFIYSTMELKRFFGVEKKKRVQFYVAGNEFVSKLIDQGLAMKMSVCVCMRR